MLSEFTHFKQLFENDSLVLFIHNGMLFLTRASEWGKLFLNKLILG